MKHELHLCGRSPPMATIIYKKNRGMHGEGYRLELRERKSKGLIEPKTEMIWVDISFCPFCGFKFEGIESHRGDCVCTACEIGRMETGQ